MSKGKGIKKCSYEYIRKNIFEQHIFPELHFHVEQLPQRAFGKDAYIITAYHEGKYYTLCMGKSLKGYKGDIIRLVYDGYCYPCGDYLLESDQHGLICKFKRNYKEELADIQLQIEAKKREIAIYKPSFSLMKYEIFEARKVIIDLMVRKAFLTTENEIYKIPENYYHLRFENIEDWDTI